MLVAVIHSRPRAVCSETREAGPGWILPRENELRWRKRCSRGVPFCQALPKMRLRLVLHTGQVALAIRVPLSLTRTSPLASRLALHFTQ